MKTIFIVICALTINTASGVETFNFGGQFYTNLPSSWVAVPDTVLKKWVQEREAATSAKLPGSFFAYQSQPTGAAWPAWLTGTTPYCIGSVFHGRNNDTELFRVASKNNADLDAKIAAIVAHQMISTTTTGTQEEMVYDSERHIVWAPISLPNSSEPEDTRMVCLFARVLTRDGYIKFQFFSTVPQYVRSIPQFRQVVESIRFTEGMEYGTSTFGGRSSGGLWSGKSWIEIITISAVFALAAVFRSRRKPKE